MLDKIGPFLLEIYNELVIKKNKKLRIRHLLIKHNMSDSSREALFKSKILKKIGYGSGTQYCWIEYLPSNDLNEKFLKTIREVNKSYRKKYKPEDEKAVPEVKQPSLIPAIILSGMVLLLVKKIFKNDNHRNRPRC